MAVLALNQQQRLTGNQFVATFTGVGYEDQLVISVGGNDVVFGDDANLPFLRSHSRTNSEFRLLVLTDLVPSDVKAFSFQIHASVPFTRAWLLNDSMGTENYQNYATTIEAGKTVELLEFLRDDSGWSIRTKNQAIGEVAPVIGEGYPEHLRELIPAARGLNPGGWSYVEAFVEVNEVTTPNLLSPLYLDVLTATQAIATTVKLAPIQVDYATFGSTLVPMETRIDEAHRAQVKALTTAGYSSTKPTVEQLLSKVDALKPGGVLIAYVNTIGGFDKDALIAQLEAREATLLLLAMRSVFGGVPNLGGSSRLRGFAVADLANPTARSVVELLRSNS
jgi:hypothetical protein